jgi:hypothetical protein
LHAFKNGLKDAHPEKDDLVERLFEIELEQTVTNKESDAEPA